MGYRAAALLAASSVFGGCGDGAEGEPEFVLAEGAEGAMIYGTNATEPKYDAVGAMLAVTAVNPDGSIALRPFCSGTLIAPRIYVTAAHCVAPGFGADNGRIYFGDEIKSPLSQYGQLVKVRSATAHPSYDPNVVKNDIALVELATVPAGITPIPRLTPALGLSASDIDKSVRFLGFGLTEESYLGSRPFEMWIKRWARDPIADVCVAAGGCYSNWLGDNLMPYTYLYDHATGGPCHGDSGGPGLVTRAGVEYVAGVTSVGIGPVWPGDPNLSDCLHTVAGTQTIVDRFDPWVQAFIDQRDPCKATTTHCDPLAGCSDAGDGTAKCGPCPAGYQDVNGDGSSCRDIDECAAGTDTCDAHAVCANTAGSFGCACATGYEGNGHTCSDIDECGRNPQACAAPLICVNTAGAFSCVASPPPPPTDPSGPPPPGAKSSSALPGAPACGDDCTSVSQSSCSAVSASSAAIWVLVPVFFRSRRRA
ncbi:MAG: trypsin-like serine protease [Deltaproteobacteria bacterium]|nr:trypsin-like serine protease [Deltaproteobacteria bacterium]